MIRLPRVIGHRGAAASAPENTRAGFAAAAGMGVEWVEFDVQLSADGVPVLFHDDRLERTTNGQGVLVEQTWTSLRRLDAGSWFAPDFAGEPILALDDALAVLAAQGLCFNIEIKAEDDRGGATARVALEHVRKSWQNPDGLLISSFSPQALAEAKRLRPDWPRGLLVGQADESGADLAETLGCISLHVDATRLDPETAASVKRRGLLLLAYTVNEENEARRLYEWGVDAVFSDRPGQLMTMMAK